MLALLKRRTMDYITILMIISALFIPILFYSIYASIRVNTVYAKYSHINNKSNLTGAEAARKILLSAGLGNVEVKPTRGSLTDHYNPADKTVYLSETTFGSNSLGAVGVAAHEVGHAIQHAKGYAPLKLRSFSVPIVNFSSKFALPVLLLSIILEIFIGVNAVTNALLTVAIVFYGVYAFFTLITLPVEFNASRRAKKQLVECGILDSEEVKASAKVLSAAAQTYVAAFLVSLVQLIRLVLMLISRSGNRK